ncbi:GerAB/ArcD/ProY family transporter [Paenibacillus albicereus]|uniref:GerAB/ArcD/ProY family transporter n=1 Tax=Paenibacillus albicereus TaxID=2726185 RepID=A0A6H2H009_9BACL|nr:GerAB/ArcD/ProY family transporter [Paenibacillus albicereus]QJC52982.1 GerAB/ArcD/ProY family transporter [Paenibacillus albicereus]
MNRYFYYSFIMVAMLNLMLFVPSVLLQERMTGAVSSLLVAILLGTLTAYAATSALARFPGLGVPEILRLYLPEWIVKPLLALFACGFFFASSLALVGYTLLLNRVLTPDLPAWNLLLVLGVICIYGSTRSSMTLLFLMEMTMVLALPVILFILFKGIRSPDVAWNAIYTVAQYVTVRPTLTSVAAGTFIFTGYINLAIFNRLHPPNFRLKGRWLIPILGSGILLTTFFLPIGYHGTMAVDRYMYVWTQTADSMTMSFGFIERVLFLFLLVYLALTLLYTSIGWHQSIELLRSMRKDIKIEVDHTKTPKSSWWISIAFFGLSVVSMFYTDEKLTIEVAELWLTIRMFVEQGTALLLLALSFKRPRDAVREAAHESA